MSKKKSKRTPKLGGQSSKTSEVPFGIEFDLQAIEGLLYQLVPGGSTTDPQVDAAQELMYQAFEEANPRRQVALARKALQVSPDCSDAYVLLATHARTHPEALELFEQGVAAGERTLGKEGFAEYEGHFWGFLETRPYMRARAGLADCLWEAGRHEEAAEHCQEMLRLNPNDNQGIRYRLASMLLNLEQHDELKRLLKVYKDDASAEWAYTRALLAFREEGDSSRARRVLNAATKVNAHVPNYLARIKPMPRKTPEYITMGGEDEAVSYAAQFLPAWKDTPGASAWLRDTLKLSPVEPPRKKRESWNQLQIVLSQLPQHEDEIWELDWRLMPTSEGGETESIWMLIALSSKDEQVVNFEVFDSCPKDGEAWSFLTMAMRSPQVGEPRRPAAVSVVRKTWFRSWRPKLQDIDVECKFDESLAQIDHWFQTAMPQLENAQRMSHASSPSDAEWSTLASLPQQVEEVWQADVRQLPTWIQLAGEPTRPWVSLVVDVDSSAVLATDLSTEERGDDWLLNGIWQAICSPAAGQAHRPAIIQVASDRHRELLAARLELLGVQCVKKSNLKQLRYLLGELADLMGAPQQRTALIHSPGVTMGQLGSFFEAAAQFYRARPWRRIPGDSVIRVASERFDSGPWFAVVMGQSGIEQGLALYEDPELLRTLLTGQLSDEESVRRTSAISVTYGEEFELAAEDLDAVKEHGWPVAGPEAFPCVLRVNPGMALRTPLQWELELLEACLRSIPDFLGKRVGKADVAANVAGDTLMLKLE